MIPNAFYSYLNRQRQSAILVTGIVLIAFLGMIDLVSGHEISFSIFYLLPISLVAWFSSGRNGYIAAFISTVAWLVADILSDHVYSHPLIPFWNATVRLGFFIIVVTILSRLKLAYESQIKLVAELREAMDRIKVLSGLIPICAWCKKIRDDEGYWQRLEIFISEHSEATFTHGICPDCKDKYKKDLISDD